MHSLKLTARKVGPRVPQAGAHAYLVASRDESWDTLTREVERHMRSTGFGPWTYTIEREHDPEFGRIVTAKWTAGMQSRCRLFVWGMRRPI